MNAVQTPDKLWGSTTLWHNAEKPVVVDELLTGKISGRDDFTINKAGDFIPLSDNHVDALMPLEGTTP